MDILEEGEYAIYSKEIPMGIMILIYSFESLNLKHLSQLINKSEATILDHIRQLLRDDYIEIDSQESAMRRGKYYKLSEKGLKTLKNILSFEAEIEKASDLPTKKSYLKLLALSYKSLINWPRNMGYSFGQYMEDHVEEFFEKPNEIPLLEKVFFSFPKITIQSRKEYEKFIRITKAYINDLEQFYHENQKRNYFLSLVSLPISDIHPIKDKRYSFTE